jgi:uncharacterized membrane protein
MIESHFRSIAKATSYRILGTLVTFFIAWILTGKFELAARIGILDTVFKIVTFYGHERVWNNISFGKKKKPEYNI